MRIGIFGQACPLVLLALTACTGQSTDQTTPPAPGLAGTSWQLVKFDGSDDTTLLPDDRAKYTIA